MIFEAKRIKISTAEKSFTLVAPIVGLDFVAGLDTEFADWNCIALSQVIRITKLEESDSDLPNLRHQEIGLLDFAKTIEKPMRIIATLSGVVEACNILAIEENFLVAENQNLIPISAITQIRMLGANQ